MKTPEIFVNANLFSMFLVQLVKRRVPQAKNELSISNVGFVPCEDKSQPMQNIKNSPVSSSRKFI